MVGKSTDSVTVEWLVPHDCRLDHGPNRAHHLAIDSYRVFVRPAIPAGTAEAPWKPVADLDHYMNRLVVGNLSRDRSYYFGVAVVNQSGQGEITSTTEPVSPEAITSKFSGMNVFLWKEIKVHSTELSAYLYIWHNFGLYWLSHGLSLFYAACYLILRPTSQIIRKPWLKYALVKTDLSITDQSQIKDCIKNVFSTV